jgi:hypothetical protein
MYHLELTPKSYELVLIELTYLIELTDKVQIPPEYSQALSSYMLTGRPLRASYRFSFQEIPKDEGECCLGLLGDPGYIAR